MMDVKTIEVESWLGEVKGVQSGRALSNPSKQRIRNVFSCIFTHAQRHEFVPQGHNPIQLVRQSGKRTREPDILTAGEMRALWEASPPMDRAAIALAFGNGLRISEAMGLRWSDVDFENGTASVVQAS